MSYVTERFSKRLRQLRESACLTQEQLANELKVSRGAISYYEKGERTPDIEFLCSLVDFFDLPYDFVLGYTDNIKHDCGFSFEAYGLSDYALSLLESNENIGMFFSDILEHKNFSKLYQYIHDVILNSHRIDKNSILFEEDTHPLDINYFSFLITQALYSIMSDVLHKEYAKILYSDFSENELKQKIDESLNRIDESFKYFDSIDSELEKHFHEEDLKKEATEKESVLLRKKVHAAFGDLNYLK